VGPGVLYWLYVRWLRRHLVPELLAGVGVAVAVALVFATIVAAGSVSGSSTQAVRAVTGPATLQLHSRSQEGMSGTLLRATQRLPGVLAAGAELEARATLLTAGGRAATVDLAGAGTSLVFLDGLAHTIPSTTLSARGIGLSSRTAGELGIGRLSPLRHASIWVSTRGKAVRVAISAVLGGEAFGALSDTRVAVMQLAELQRRMGVGNRVSRILVQPRRGEGARVRAELEGLAHERIDVAGADQDVGLLSQALRPSDQASGLFATVSALLGVLLASAALLLSAPDRRRAIAELRLMGMRRSAIVQTVAFQTLTLGAVASAVGIACGYVLSVTLLAQSPRYLEEAFTLGTQTTLSRTAVLAAVGTGVVSCAITSTFSLLDLRERNPLRGIYRRPGVPGNGLHVSTLRVLDVSALVLLLAASVLYLTGPSHALLACAMLAVGTVCAVPPALRGAMAGCAKLARWRESLTAMPVALSSLQATTLRSFALAATGALALFGSIALGGARGDLTHGIARFAHSYTADAELWVGNRGDDQAVVDFRAGDLPGRIARLPGVAGVTNPPSPPLHSSSAAVNTPRPHSSPTGVKIFRGGFVTLDGRRAWLIARPFGAARSVLSSQIVSGSPALAEERLARGGWVVVSQQIAADQHAGVGDMLMLPTPGGKVRLRIAALTSNLAWSPGALFLGSAQYTRLWPGAGATALGVSLKPGARVDAVTQEIRHVLGPSSGLVVRTSASLQASIDTLAKEGLRQLREISNLLLVAAVLAMLAALTSAVWQRREALAGLRLCGASPARLRRVLAVEAGLLLSAGCVTGALAGVYGQAIIDGYLGRVTGFPLVAGVDARPLQTFALVVTIVFAAALMPIAVASRVSPRYALGGPVALAVALCVALGGANVARGASLRAVDTAKLHYLGAVGEEVSEAGSASGTLAGGIRVRMIFASTISGSFAIYTHGGRIDGHGRAKPHGEGVWESFAGTLTVTGGTGRYRHARGTARLYGTFDRENYALRIQTAGTLRY
jgi:putative ABC transport system permease protein